MKTTPNRTALFAIFSTALIVGFLAFDSRAEDTHVGSIFSTTVVSRSNIDAGFVLYGGGSYAIQCDNAARVHTSSDAGPATSSNVLVRSGALYEPGRLAPSTRFVSTLCAPGGDGGCLCDVYAVTK